MEEPILLFRKDNLSPEQLRAVEILEQAKTYNDVETVPTLEALASKDSKILVKKKLRTKDLPKGDGWTWNQSRGRKCTQNINDTIDLCFYKLTTRVRANSGDNPGYKLWIFNIVDKVNDAASTFLWCERGSEDVESDAHGVSTQDERQWSLNNWKTEEPQGSRTYGHYGQTSQAVDSPNHTPLAPLKLSEPGYFPNSVDSPNTIDSINIAANTLTNIRPLAQESFEMQKSDHLYSLSNATNLQNQHTTPQTLPPLQVPKQKPKNKITGASAVFNLISLSTSKAEDSYHNNVSNNYTTQHNQKYLTSGTKASPSPPYNAKSSTSESNPADTFAGETLETNKRNFPYSPVAPLAKIQKTISTIHEPEPSEHTILKADRSTITSSGS